VFTKGLGVCGARAGGPRPPGRTRGPSLHNLEKPVQACLLLRREPPNFPFRKFAQDNVSDRYPDQAENFNAQSLENSSNLTVLALIQRHLDPGILLATA